VCELQVNCRNTPSVARLACVCAGVDPAQCRVMRADDEPPEIHAWDDPEQQQELLLRCLEELHDDGMAWDDIVILSTVADARSACAALPARPWGERLEHVTQYTPGMDLASEGARWRHVGGKVLCATIHRFKGLEARAVVITDVTSFDETGRALLYVGVTRTVERLVVLARPGPAPELRTLLATAD
jgi:superfamily I DNA/RNA helicase